MPGGTLLSLLVFVFLVVDDYEDQVCVDDVHYHQRAPFCLTQACTCSRRPGCQVRSLTFLGVSRCGARAVLSVGLYVWMLLWQACIAANLWITVVLQVRNPNRTDDENPTTKRPLT